MNIIEKLPPYPCKYYNQCGGCDLQHALNYFDYKFNLCKKKFEEISFKGQLFPLIEIPCGVRRRATFKIFNNKLGFNKRNSNEIIAVERCIVVEDQINNLITPLNKILPQLKKKVDKVSLTNSDTGIEIVFISRERSDLNIDTKLAQFAHQNDISRIVWNNSTLVQRKPVQLLFSDIKIDLPIDSFLQVSKNSQEEMTRIIKENLQPKEKILELYCGVGSFTIPLSRQNSVVAVEGSSEAIKALESAIRTYKLPITTIIQDLYQNPVKKIEVNQIVINPPRNGAGPQIREIAKSKAEKIILISCSLENFIRDAKTLLNAGFKIPKIYPIDQFIYTHHLEIIGIFQK